MGNAPKLMKELSAGVQTDFTLQQIIQLAYLAQEIKPDDIKRGASSRA